MVVLRYPWRYGSTGRRRRLRRWRLGVWDILGIKGGAETFNTCYTLSGGCRRSVVNGRRRGRGWCGGVGVGRVGGPSKVSDQILNFWFRVWTDGGLAMERHRRGDVRRCGPGVGYR